MREREGQADMVDKTWTEGDQRGQRGRPLCRIKTLPVNAC